MDPLTIATRERLSRCWFGNQDLMANPPGPESALYAVLMAMRKDPGDGRLGLTIPEVLLRTKFLRGGNGLNAQRKLWGEELIYYALLFLDTQKYIEMVTDGGEYRRTQLGIDLTAKILEQLPNFSEDY